MCEIKTENEYSVEEDWYAEYLNILEGYKESTTNEFYDDESVMYVLNGVIYWCKNKLESVLQKWLNIKIYYDITISIMQNIYTGMKVG